jgi:8-oxo-dGTP diphosphatase
MVLAAGGLVVRPMSGSGSGQDLEVAVVHRPEPRADWSFPKGKLERKESLTTCALREVWEETGLVCSVISFAGTTEYIDRKDRPKVVAYWTMTPVAGSFEASDEVDELRWVSLEDAHELLSYERDRELLAEVVDQLAWTFLSLRTSA